MNMVLNDSSSNGTTEGFGCSTYDLEAITTHLHFSSQCDARVFNSEKNVPQKSLEARNSDLNFQDSIRDGGAGDTSQIQCKTIKSGVFSAEDGLVSSIETSKKASPASLQFYVRSEEGINLYVDLSSSPSDWIKGFKNEVDLYQKVQSSKSRVLHQKLNSLGDSDEQMKISSFWNRELDFQTKGDHICTKSSVSSFVEESCLLADHHPYVTNGSIRSSAITSCSTPVEISGHLEDVDGVLSSLSRPNSDVQILMVSDTNTSLGGEIVSLDSEVPDISQIKSTCNSILDTKLDGPNCPDPLKNQSSKFCSPCPENSKRRCLRTSSVSQDRDLSVSGEICEDSVPLNTANSENPSEVCPGCSTSISMEMQLSEVASHCKGTMNSSFQNCGPLNLGDLMHGKQTKNGESANCGLDQRTCGDPPPAHAEEWERSSPMNVRDISDCSQIDNSFKKTCKRSHSLQFRRGLRSKKPHADGVDRNGFTRPAVRNLRSAKHLARSALPRRSSRLVSK